MAFIGIEKGERRSSFSGNIRDPIDFILKMNWTFPNGVDKERTIFEAYGAELDQYMVVGKNGRLSYVSEVTGFEEGAIDVPSLVDAIQNALLGRPVPTLPTTWSRLRTLWAVD